MSLKSINLEAMSWKIEPTDIENCFKTIWMVKEDVVGILQREICNRSGPLAI